MPAWPTTLPCMPINGTLRVAQESNISEFKPDVGRPQRSRRYTLRRRLYTGTLKLTTAQRAILDEFFHEDCADGVNSFTMRDWIPNSDSPLGTGTFTFVNAPEYDYTGPNRWFVNLELAREDG